MKFFFSLILSLLFSFTAYCELVDVPESFIMVVKLPYSYGAGADEWRAFEYDRHGNYIDQYQPSVPINFPPSIIDNDIRELININTSTPGTIEGTEIAALYTQQDPTAGAPYQREHITTFNRTSLAQWESLIDYFPWGSLEQFRWKGLVLGPYNHRGEREIITCSYEYWSPANETCRLWGGGEVTESIGYELSALDMTSGQRFYSLTNELGSLFLTFEGGMINYNHHLRDSFTGDILPQVYTPRPYRQFEWLQAYLIDAVDFPNFNYYSEEVHDDFIIEKTNGEYLLCAIYGPPSGPISFGCLVPDIPGQKIQEGPYFQFSPGCDLENDLQMTLSPGNSPQITYSRFRSLLFGTPGSYCDLDDSGSASINDALFLARYSAGLLEADEQNLIDAGCDFNGDLLVTILDAMEAARLAAGL